MLDKRSEICKHALAQREVNVFWEHVNKQKGRLESDIKEQVGKFDDNSMTELCAKTLALGYIVSILSWHETP